MASLVYHKGERAIIEAVLCGQTNFGTPVLIPAVAGNWGLGMGTKVGGIGIDKTDDISDIIELGNATPNGYGRSILTRDHTGWPAPTLTGLHYTTTAQQHTFTFTGSPSPNVATFWFIAGSSTVSQDNALFGADLAAARTFNMGDLERITPAYSQG